MSSLVEILASALLLSFIFCCVASGLLQLRAWGRHVRPDVTMSLRGLRHPEQYFDEVGLRQMLLARRLLAIGGVAYVTYGLIVVVSHFRVS